MEDFLKKVVEGNGIDPSEVCLQSFNENFADAKVAEWSRKGNHYEVIFYMNDLEHIALFNDMGFLMEYRQDLPIDYLPGNVKKRVTSRGEIMNAVLKNQGNMLYYEVIIKDKKLNRFQITLSVNGKIVEEKKL